jgi:hypothetical protein
LSGGIAAQMGKKQKKVLISGGIIFFIFLLGMGYFIIQRDFSEVQDQGRIQTQMQSRKSDAKLPPILQNASVKEKFDSMGISVEDQLVKELRKYYGSTISEKSTQASIYDIRKAIVGSNPDGMQLFYNALKRAFPDYVDEIMETLDKLDDYNQWLEKNEQRLSQMSEESRMAALWEKRISLFGEDAQEIWADEMTVADARRSKYKETIDLIDRSKDITMEEKLNIFQDTLQKIYEGSPEAFLLDQSFTMSKAFFSIDSVQDELTRMDPDERQMTINKIRREMGFSDQQVEKMEKLDAKRNEKWEIGLAYMAEREKVVSEYEGEEQKEKLTALREKYFQDRAKTIELEEEKDKFFRFERPRFYGRN